MRVTLDLFSGRPNPTWTLSGRQARELRGRMAGSPPLVQAARTGPTAEPSRLGFRGFVVHEDEPGELLPSPVPRAAPAAARVAAPDLLAIRAEGAEEAATAVSDEVDTAEWLIATAPEAVVGGMVDELAGELRDLRSASGAAVRTARTTREAPEDGSEAGARGRDRDLDDVTGGEACRPYLLPMNLAFWNTPGIQPYNNCYNYATNFVSGTLAQPGRRSGWIYRAFQCSEVLEAARRDGLELTCDGGVRVVALGIWPGFDFHWWRLHPDGFWAHKIGWWPAQNRDNSFRIIGNGLTPANCDRGPYREFCGYYFAPLSMWVL